MRRDALLWLGSIYPSEHIQGNPAISPAANHWQSRLIDGIRGVGVDVILLAHEHARVWPRGPLYVGRPAFARGMPDQLWSGYLNVPGIKPASIARSMRRVAVAELDRRPPLAIVSYNPTSENLAVGRFLQDRYRTPWIDLCADAYSPGEGWVDFPAGARHASGHIFLSHGAYVDCPFSPKLHLDGGVDWIDAPAIASSADRVPVLYTGMMGPYGGVDSLVKAFELTRDPRLELWICGHGAPSALLTDAVARNPRIRFFGQVDEATLGRLMAEAHTFINPRPGNLDGGDMNFPSKLLRYLAYGKPIISTRTAGLAPEYEDVLTLVPPDDDHTLAAAIDGVARLTDAELADRRARAKAFATDNRNWGRQAERLVGWLRTLASTTNT